MLLCSVFWLFWLSCQYLPSDWLEEILWGSLIVAIGSSSQSPGQKCLWYSWFNVLFHCSMMCIAVVKVVLWSGGWGEAHLTKPGWSKPHTHSNPTNLGLFRHKITLYRFSQGRGLILLQGAQMGAVGSEPPWTPHFNHWCIVLSLGPAWSVSYSYGTM